jgi:hypothetical protein
MSNKNKNINNDTISDKILRKSSINLSLINISKQLSNISINDVNILKFKNERNKINSKNKKDSTLQKEIDNNYINKSFSKYKCKIYNNLASFSTDVNDFNDLSFKFFHAISFSIKADKNIYLLNKNDLRKKNFILKENIKFLLNEIKKHKNNKITNEFKQIKEYENKIEYYVNEINKYKRDIIILKEKYNDILEENKKLKDYIQSGESKRSIKTNYINNTNNNLIKSMKSNKSNRLKNLNFNLKNYPNKENINKENYSICTTRASRNNKKVDFNIINNINSNKYLLIEDKQSFQNGKEKTVQKNILNNNSGFIIHPNIVKRNNKSIIINNKNSFQRMKRNNKKNINQIIFSRIINKNTDNNRTLSKNILNQTSFNNKSFELNKTINSSQSFRYYKDNEIKNIERKSLIQNKLNNFLYIKNNTLQNF